jgi:hypothetical protein
MKNFDNMTNEEFVVSCMNFSKHGALGQIALLQCIKLGIDEFQKAEKANRKIADNYEKEGKITMICYHSFHDAVNELADKWNLMYEEKTLHKKQK